MSEVKYNIRPLQEEVLKIFKVFAAICEKHGLRYYAAYGTALGAIRHHGFIPWDDDFDVAMPRSDYHKFARVANGELPSFLRFLRGGESYYSPILFGRVLNIDGMVIDKLKAITGLALKDPPFIDVFVLDDLPENALGLMGWRREYRLWRVCQIWRYPHAGYNSSWKHKIIARTLGWLLNPRYRRTTSNEDMMCVLDELSMRWPRSRHVIEWAFFHMNEARVLAKSLFEPFRLVSFEDVQIRVPYNVEEILTRYYGDYMKLPPEKDRVPPHVMRYNYDGHV